MGTAPATLASPPSPTKVALASFIGTTIEWYDYYIFGAATVLVLNSQFFPTLDPLAGTLASFATFAVAFIARPFGGAFFGHFGDRIGRKKMLIWSVLTMGLGTLLVGLLPNYAAIGIWAPILLVVCRFLQGFAVGGEWGGAVLMSLEHAPANKRAFFASFPQAGVPAGTVLSSGTFALLSLMPEDQLLSWGWRIPFIASIVLVAVGLWIRLKVTESPEFLKIQEKNEVPKVPAFDVFKSHKRSLVHGILCGFAPNFTFYIATVFLVSYGPKQLGIPSGTIFVALMIAATLQVFTLPFFATFADKHSLKRVLLTGCVLVAAGAFPVFALFSTGTFWGILAALIIALPVLHAISYGVISGFTAELFPTEVRYTGTSLAYQLGGIITSAPVPIIATLLIERYNSSDAVAWYMVISAVLGFIAIATAKTVRKTRGSENAHTDELTV
ncbi:MFS transporter [Arthrobacter sedimenti]|uniref:MFS transporter n=1 Tax=Arthrobacter sedimenti TaxID=2694931 RepID=UPI000B35ADE9|nr:MFS transporter [Arthrobacter sedimenti]OUM45091.1 MFS transporter [Arthrobacter agilis]